MARMMQDMHGPGYVGNADIDFLAMMIPHHAGAVDMARLVLQHGRDPATRQLADEIIAGQTTEIESMQRRLCLLLRGHLRGAAVRRRAAALGREFWAAYVADGSIAGPHDRPLTGS